MTEPPVQAWAHKDGLIDLKPLAAGSWTDEAVATRLQIAETFYRFAIGHDEARLDVVLSCFAEDGVFMVSQGQAEPFTSHQGRPEIHAALLNVIGQQNDQRRHLMSNIVIEDLTDLTARVVAYGLVSAIGHGHGLRLGASVIYVAELSREADGCWRFSRFHIGMDAYAGDKPMARKMTHTD